eukprot:755347-Hanusia_phi.AAC.1
MEERKNEEGNAKGDNDRRRRRRRRWWRKNRSRIRLRPHSAAVEEKFLPVGSCEHDPGISDHKTEALCARDGN